jgi:hypothetical protein
MPARASTNPALSAAESVESPTAWTPAWALPASKQTPALPPPASEGAGAGAIQKAFSPHPAHATALALPALPDADGPGTGAGDGLRLSLPPAVAARLRSLLDRHESGKTLTAAERAEAQGLLDIAEYFAIQRLRSRLAA